MREGGARVLVAQLASDDESLRRCDARLIALGIVSVWHITNDIAPGSANLYLYEVPRSIFRFMYWLAEGSVCDVVRELTEYRNRSKITRTQVVSSGYSAAS